MSSVNLPKYLLKKLSFSSLALVNDPFDWAYELEDIGFSGWEIVHEGKQRLEGDNLKKIRDILETTDLAITVHMPFSDLNFASLNHPIWVETIHQMGECIKTASEFTDIVTVHPGSLSPLGFQMRDIAWGNNVEGLQKICDIAEEFGITVCLENMPNMEHILGRQALEVLGIMELTERNIGCTFDVGHANTTGTIDDFLKIKENFTHIHFHDNMGIKDEHLQLGAGNIDWQKVLVGLRDYDGRVVIEARSVEEGKNSVEYLARMFEGES